MWSSRFLLRAFRTSQLTARGSQLAPRVSVRYASGGLPSESTDEPRTVEHKERVQENADDYRKTQMEKPLNPHMTNTTSTIANEMPSVGSDKAPADMITNVDPDFEPKDAVPENTERMTGDTQKGDPDSGQNKDLGVGEMEGAEFKVEPLRREGEDGVTMRARLLYQSRKRGTLESDLLMSTFAQTHLPTMTKSQMAQYDLFLDENDWDIYYWATQTPTPTSLETADGSIEMKDTKPAPQSFSADTDPWRKGKPRSGEWAQTVGTFKPAYRPVPQRWKNSEILSMLRRHVRERMAGGVREGDMNTATGSGKVGSGLGMMPEVQVFSS